ncbi:MAG: hypothetical protein EAZ97_04175 [Bacteroidetes bacterium]|nr:MAG: hypothetical protein EAZ97_04175 [Bacteroidota bacterium]
MKKLIFSEKYYGFYAFLGTFFLYLLYFTFFEAYLNSDDDRPMSMLAAGVFNESSEHLLFQNILMGLFFKSLYALQKWQWYDVWMLLMLFLSHWAIFYSLLRLKIHFWISFLFISYLIASQLSYINFTTTSAYLGIAGMLLFFSELKQNQNKFVLPTFLLIFSSLIRFQSTVLVTILFVPFFLYQIWAAQIQWKNLVKFLGLSFFLMTFFVVFDKIYTENLSPEWKKVYEFQKVRPQFFDYDAIPMKPYEEVYKKYHFSENDFMLFKSFVFYWADPDFYSSQRLNSMLSEVDRMSIKYIRLRGIKEIPYKIWTILWQKKEFLLFLFAFILAFFPYSPKKTLYIGVHLSMIFAMYVLFILFLKTVHYVDYVIFSVLILLSILVSDRKFHFVFAPVFAILYFLMPVLPQKTDVVQNNEAFITTLNTKTPYLWLTESPFSFMDMKLFADIYKYQNYNFVSFNAPYTKKHNQKYKIQIPAKDLIDQPEIVLIFTKRSASMLKYYQIYMQEHEQKSVFFEKIGERYGYELYKAKSGFLNIQKKD